jgi:hypothetical protein
VGIIQEQHPDRCRLFMQWKRMDWPVMVDALNLGGIDVVPVAYAIDEQGTVRFVNPSEADFQAFLQSPATKAAPPPPASAGPLDLGRLRDLTRGGGAAAWRAYGDALFLWGGDGQLDEVVQAYERAAQAEPDAGATQFRLGSAYRRRDDSNSPRPGDFQRAAERWARALELDPNQYIWRRRLQQYGPRLDKPYPFYDWVDEARREIVARGEEPAPLAVEPGGAEIAAPTERFEARGPEGKEPDPDGRIRRDPGRLVEIEVAAVPPAVKAGGVTRVHLVFRLNPAVDAHWNNEGGPLRAWAEPPPGWTADRREREAPSPRDMVSTETREIDFELRASELAPPGGSRVRAYALYYVCEGATGVCLYRRQDVSLPVEMRP